MTFSGRTYPSEVEAERAHRRRWILIPGVVVLLCVVFGMVSMIGPFQTHEDTISQMYAGDVKKVVVDSPGDLEVGPSPTGAPIGEWETHWNYNRPRVQQVRDGDTLRLSLDCSRSVGVECYADVRLAIPKGVELDVTSHNGTTDVRDVSGPVRVDNSSGDVRVEGVGADVHAATKNGNVKLRDIDGEVTADSRSGDIDARELGGSVARLDTRSGDVKADFRTVPSLVSAQTLSGDVDVRVPKGSGPYQVRSDVKSGELETQVPTDPSAKSVIDVSTRSGDARIKYTDDGPGSSHDHSHHDNGWPVPPVPPAPPEPPDPGGPR